MNSDHGLAQIFTIRGGDFGNAGSVSTQIKEILQEIGVDAATIRRIAIATYEAEMNVVMYARKATMSIILATDKIRISIVDEGQGIEDINRAMQEGYSTATDEMREMGFGAGMGLPNIKRNADEFDISSIPGEGTSLDLVFYLNQAKQS